MRRAPFVLCVFLLAIQFFALAQKKVDAAPPLPMPVMPQVVKDAAAAQVLEAAIQAMGGRDLISSITSTRCEGTMDKNRKNMPPEQSTFIWTDDFSSARHKFRKEIVAGGHRRVIASGKELPAAVFSGKAKRLGGHFSLANAPLHIPAIALLQILENRDTTIQLRTTSSDRPGTIHVYTVRESNPITHELTPQDWYFDALTGLPVRVTYRVADTMGPTSVHTSTLEFNDFRDINGIKTPNTLIAHLRSGATNVIKISTLSFNSMIDPQEFELTGESQ